MFRSSLLCAVLLAASPLWLAGQNTVPGAAERGEERAQTGGDVTFAPIIPLLEAVTSGHLTWRPDWPVSLPPDVFSPLRGPWLSLVFSNGLGEEYRLARNQEGLLTDFPFFREGVFFQVRARFDTEGRIGGFTLESGGKSEAPSPAGEQSQLLVEFLEEKDSEPYMARVTGKGGVYFVVFRFGDQDAAETWYDADGVVRRIVSFHYITLNGERRLTDIREKGDTGETVETFDYDSWGNVSGVRSAEGAFSVHYGREARPRYWEGPLRFPQLKDPAAAPKAGSGSASPVQAAVNLSLQWDEKGFLVALSRIELDGEGEGIRYEYALDEWGNWRERREVFMFLRFGYLVPAAGETLWRRIEYRQGDEGERIG
ncbi:MAG: hypothetical protein LBG76_05455 [Treponema sp.]|jgi:YD repeat-containing protein|nr:hypothetical protein [Treponema sp.]